MKRCMYRFSYVLLVACLASSISQVAQAHFPWLVADDQGHALLFFSENPHERDYRLPEAVLKAEVTAHQSEAKAKKLELKTLEEGDVIGRRSPKSLAKNSTLQTAFSYGIYHGTLLQYYAHHLQPVGAKAFAIDTKEQLPMQAAIERTKTGMQVQVLWKGKPLQEASVTIIDADGESAEEKTDAKGKASFATGAEGLTGFVIGHVIKDVDGELDGKEYSSESHYCTVTTDYHKKTSANSKSGSGTKSNTPATKQASTYAPLPEAISSFGAAISDNWLYVYSGHTGKAHAHSRENLSKNFCRLNLNGKGEWEQLEMQTPLQGIPMVAHAGKLYRIGGLNAHNAKGEEDDLHSVNEFACYDPEAKAWTTLADLPERRSSHDAVVIGDKVYVVGGWRLGGDDGGEWIEEVWSFDLNKADGAWKAEPKLNFCRRALAAAQWNGKLIVLGGMDEDHDIRRTVECLDLETGKWSELADYPGEGMSGFGISAWNVGGKLYASGSAGIVYQLNDDGKAWTEVKKLNIPRFFHRLLATSSKELLIIAGASLGDGHLTDIEVIEVKN